MLQICALFKSLSKFCGLSIPCYVEPYDTQSSGSQVMYDTEVVVQAGVSLDPTPDLSDSSYSPQADRRP